MKINKETTGTELFDRFERFLLKLILKMSVLNQWFLENIVGSNGQQVPLQLIDWNCGESVDRLHCVLEEGRRISRTDPF